MQDRIIIKALELGPFAANCYLVGTPGSASFVIDPADELDRIKAVVKKHDFRVRFVINTHGHIDHIKEDEAFGVPVFIHRLDKPLLSDPAANLSSFLSIPFAVDERVQVKELEDGERLDLNGNALEIIHTPGHTQGGICIKFQKYLFSGDTLFFRSIGRTDFKGGDYDQLIRSIKKKLFSLDGDYVVLPGHGPKTTLAEERQNNPFLQ